MTAIIIITAILVFLIWTGFGMVTFVDNVDFVFDEIKTFKKRLIYSCILGPAAVFLLLLFSMIDMFFRVTENYDVGVFERYGNHIKQWLTKD